MLFPQPSRAPSSSPSISPSDIPSSVPTEEPFNEASGLPRQQLLVSDVNMTIGGILLPLSGEAQESLELIISDNVARSVIQVLGRDNVENLEVDVSLILPSLREVAERADDNDSLLLDMLIMIQSVIHVHNANRYILGAFNGDSEKELFLQNLKETGHIEFASVESVSVAPVTDVVLIIPEAQTTNENDSRTALAVVLPTVIGVVLAICAAGIVFYRRKRASREINMFRSKHGEVNDDDGSKINMVVNTTHDTSNMSILEEPIFGAHNSDMIIDAGEVSTIGDPSMNNSLFGGSRLGDFDLKHMHIDANILDDDTFHEEEILPNTRKSKIKGSMPVGTSDDGSSAVGSMSVMSTPMSVDYDFHKLHQIKSKTIVSGTLPTSYDDFYASQELLDKKNASALLKIPIELSDGASKSVLGDNCSFDYDYYKSIQGSVGENKVATPSEVSTDSLKDSASGVVLLDDSISLGRQLDAAYESPAPTEEDVSVADSMPRIPKTLPYEQSKMESLNEDITVTDSLPGRNVMIDVPVVVSNVAVNESGSRVSDSLPPGIDVQRSRRNSNLLNFLSEDGIYMNDTLSFDYGLSRKYSRNSSIKEGKDYRWEVASSIPTSDASYAATFEISVPKGSLGLTLKASYLGVPEVVMLKSSSPLCRKVRTGDWLIKLDGMDVSSMKARDVSRLISSKKNQPVRRFVFARTLDEVEGEVDTVYEA
jgi:hypothetical protein